MRECQHMARTLSSASLYRSCNGPTFFDSILCQLKDSGLQVIDIAHCMTVPMVASADLWGSARISFRALTTLQTGMAGHAGLRLTPD